jgi:hypothetical protein
VFETRGRLHRAASQAGKSQYPRDGREPGPLWETSGLDYTASASMGKRLVKSPEDRIGRIADRTPCAHIHPGADPHESPVKRPSPKENNI